MNFYPCGKSQFQALGTCLAYIPLFVKTVLNKNKQTKKGNITMKTIKTLGLLAAGLLGSVALANANDLGTTAYLNQLAGTGNTLVVGDKTFGNFTDTESGLNGFNADAIVVTAYQSGGVYYLQWTGNMQGGGSADLELQYSVTTTGPLIDMIDQNFNGSAVNGFVTVQETATINAFGGTTVGSSLVDPLVFSTPLTYLISPWESEIYVTKDITFFANGGGPTYDTISQVTQSFHQVPDGGMTVSILGLALMGCGLLRRTVLK